MGWRFSMCGKQGCPSGPLGARGPRGKKPETKELTKRDIKRSGEISPEGMKIIELRNNLHSLVYNESSNDTFDSEIVESFKVLDSLIKKVIK